MSDNLKSIVSNFMDNRKYNWEQVRENTKVLKLVLGLNIQREVSDDEISNLVPVAQVRKLLNIRVMLWQGCQKSIAFSDDSDKIGKSQISARSRVIANFKIPAIQTIVLTQFS